MNRERINHRVSSENDNDYVLYIMCNSFRANHNHGILHTLQTAKSRHKKAYIILYKEPEENPIINKYFEHGIANYKTVFGEIFDKVFYYKIYDNGIDKLIKNANHVVKDMAYLKEEIQFEDIVYQGCRDEKVGFDTVESNVIVPIRIASDKEEYSARTIRKKIMTKLDDFLDLENTTFKKISYEEKAFEVLNVFIKNKYAFYNLRNDPATEYTSNLSPFLKFGFISPQTIVKEIYFAGGENTELFLEELIVRRELAYNFIYYNKNYDLFNEMTYKWSYETMENHLMDDREYLYKIEDYISFSTHDKYFNTAMKEMIYFGKMHSYMRMYWCKKIIEWSKTYTEAYEIAIYLNNYYFIDGNTPNGYNGIAWCFGKHDRAWNERLIFGKLRYMNSNGLKRKFAIDKYVERIERMVGELNG